MTGQETEPVNNTETPPSVTAVLFGDTFAPAVPTGKKGTVAYATGVTVETENLARKMIMLDIIHLQNTGYIEVEPFLRKVVLRLGVAGVSIRVTDEDGLRSSPGRIARTIAADKNARQDGANVRHIIAQAFPMSVNPHQMMVQLGLDDAAELGYLKLERDPGWRGIARALIGHATTIPNMARIHALQPTAEALAAEWTRFNEANANTTDQLWEWIEEGILSRKERAPGAPA